MKKKTFLLCLTMAFSLIMSVSVSAIPVVVPLQVGFNDPSIEQGGPHRGPIIPEVSIDGYTLLFVTPCDGLELRLVNEENEVEFTTIISGTMLVLPTYLSGNYELQIISGNYIFYGDISL